MTTYIGDKLVRTRSSSPADFDGTALLDVVRVLDLEPGVCARPAGGQREGEDGENAESTHLW